MKQSKISEDLAEQSITSAMKINWIVRLIFPRLPLQITMQKLKEVRSIGTISSHYGED